MRMGYTSKPSTTWLESQVPSGAELQGFESYLWVTYNLFCLLLCVPIEVERSFQAKQQNTLKPWSPTKNPHSSS